MSNIGNQRSLSAILFADIQGYTAIMQSDEAQAVVFLNHYQSSLSIEVNKHNGEIVKNYGDGSLCLFSSVLEAVQCAKDLQSRLSQEPKVPLRIGLHLGDVMHADNDVYGDSINIASRIEGMGVAGNVLLSKSVHDKVKNHKHLQMQSLGTFDFKNVENEIEVFALSNEGLVVPDREELKGKFKPTSTKPALSRSWIYVLTTLVLIGFGVFGFSVLNKKDGNDISNKTSLAGKQKSSIAVLAFSDMSSKQDQKYFSEGISEEILNLLTRIPNLKVISRTSSFAFKDKQVTTKEIGDILNVEHVLEGSIRKSGNQFRISTQLIHAESGSQLWSETYERSMDDIFKIQDDIASKIIQQLKVNLLGKEIEAKTVNVDAYNLYLEAKLLREQRNMESDSIAENVIREALELDNSYAPAWAILSELIFNGAFSYSRYSIEDGMSKSLEAAEKAIELDPNSSYGYIAMTTLKRAENDFKSAERYLKKALEIDPENVDVIYESASYALDLGNLDEAIMHLKKAIQLDPINYLLTYTLGLHYIWTEEYTAAEKAMGKYIRMNPNSGLANNFMAQIHLKLGKSDKAFEALAKDDDLYWVLYRKSIIYNELGDKKSSDKYLKEFEEKFGDEGWPNIAHVYACRGEADKAFHWLNLAFENKDASLMEILNYPEFDILYRDSRWKTLIEKLNFPSNHGFYKKG